jgi:uncharacterized protein YoxC
MEIIYNITFILVSILIIIILALLVKLIYDLDKNVKEGKNVIENISGIAKNTKDEQEKINTLINNKIDKVNVLGKIKTADKILNTIVKLIRKKEE